MWQTNKRMVHGYLVLAALSLALPACAQTPAKPSAAALAQTAPVPASKATAAYGDCSLIDFKDIDSSQLTKAELVQRMDQDFTDNLNKNEKCMAEAITSGAGRLEAVGSGASANGQAISATGDAAGAAQATQETESQGQSGQESTSSSSRTTQKGQGQQGSSAVCDTVKQGLAGATTESEKTHFQALMKQYGC